MIFFCFLRQNYLEHAPNCTTWCFEHDDGSKLFLISWTHRGFIFKLTFKGLFPHLTGRMYQSMSPIEVWRMPHLDICPKSIKVLTEKDKGRCLSCGSFQGHPTEWEKENVREDELQCSREPFCLFTPSLLVFPLFMPLQDVGGHVTPLLKSEESLNFLSWLDKNRWPKTMYKNILSVHLSAFRTVKLPPLLLPYCRWW